MPTYTVFINNARKPLITTTDIVKARRAAVLKLIELDKKVGDAYLFKNGDCIANIAMLVGPDMYVKPSIGLRKGLTFVYDDYSEFKAVYTNGKLGPFKNLRGII